MADSSEFLDQYTGGVEPPIRLQPNERVLTVGKDRYDPVQTEQLIRSRAAAYGIDPDTAVRVAKSEGLRGYTGDGGSSFGPFQLHYGGMTSGGNAVGGLGDEFTKATGLHARDPSTVPQQIDYVLSHAAKNGWGAFHGAANSGIGEFAGIGGNPAAPTQAALLPSQQQNLFKDVRTPEDYQKALDKMMVLQTSPDIQAYKMSATPGSPPPPASVGALPLSPGAAKVTAPVPWGAGINTLSGMAFGAGPIAAGAGGAIAAMGADLGAGRSPSTALLNAPSYYSAARDLATQAQGEWTKENPGTALATDLAGGMVPALAGAGALTTAGRAVAAPLTRMAPSLAPAVGATGDFLAGQSGNFQSLPGVAARLGSWTSAGALQGAAAGAAQTGITGGTVGGNAERGAIAGAALGIPLGWAGNALASPFRAEVNPGMRSLSGEASAAGVELPGSALTDNKGVQKLAGIGRSPITKDLAQKVDQVLRDQYTRLEQAGGTALDLQFRQEMQQLRGEIGAAKYLEAGDKRKLNDIISRANNPNGAISGRDLVGFTRASGKLNDLQSDADLKPFASRIMDSLFGVMERNNPQAYTAYRDLRQQVGAWGQVMSRESPSKMANALHLAQSVGKGAFAGELAGDLLAGGAVHGLLSGELSPVAAATMLHSGSVVPLLMAGAGAASGYAARRAMGAFVKTPTYGNVLMGGGMPALPNAGIPPLVQLYNREQEPRR